MNSSSSSTPIKGESTHQRTVRKHRAINDTLPEFIMSSIFATFYFFLHFIFSRKSLTLKYYARKILYFLRQQNILRSLKTFLEQPEEQQSALEGKAQSYLVFALGIIDKNTNVSIISTIDDRKLGSYLTLSSP